MANKYPETVISHWSTLIEGLDASPLAFFEYVEVAANHRAIPEIEISRMDYHEGGIFSAKREYLRIRQGKFLFDICASPYGTGFFVSWWLGRNLPFLLSIPIIGAIYGRFLKPNTYYTLDSADMFQTATHLAVLQAVDGLTATKGLRTLSESERRPTMRAALAR